MFFIGAHQTYESINDPSIVHWYPVHHVHTNIASHRASHHQCGSPKRHVPPFPACITQPFYPPSSHSARNSPLCPSAQPPNSHNSAAPRFSSSPPSPDLHPQNIPHPPHQSNLPPHLAPLSPLPSHSPPDASSHPNPRAHSGRSRALTAFAQGVPHDLSRAPSSADCGLRGRHASFRGTFEPCRRWMRRRRRWGRPLCFFRGGLRWGGVGRMVREVWGRGEGRGRHHPF